MREPVFIKTKNDREKWNCLSHETKNKYIQEFNAISVQLSELDKEYIKPENIDLEQLELLIETFY